MSRVSHRRPRLRGGDQPAGDPRPASTVETGSRSSRWPRTSPTPGRSSERAAAGVEIGRLRAARPPRPSRTGTPPWPIGSISARSTWSCSPATWSCCRPSSCGDSTGRIVNVHPALLPVVPGPRPDRAGARPRRPGHRGDGPLRRRGRRLRGRSSCSVRSTCHTLATARSSRSRSTGSSIELLPEAIRMIASGAVSVDAGESATRPSR